LTLIKNSLIGTGIIIPGKRGISKIQKAASFEAAF
jgi:hypothetical protein